MWYTMAPAQRLQLLVMVGKIVSERGGSMENPHKFIIELRRLVVDDPEFINDLSETTTMA